MKDWHRAIGWVNAFKKAYEYTPVTEEVNDVCDWFLSEIQRLRWITVENRLPDKQGWYDVTYKPGKMSNERYVRQLYWDEKHKEFIDNIRYEENGLKDIEKYFWTDCVIAWKPVANPYTG